jgi:signal transduction histidine kinase
MLLNVTPEQTDKANDLLFEKIEQCKASPRDLSLLQKQDRVDELTDWLEDRDVDQAEEIAETLTDFCFDEEDLENLLDALGDESKLGPTLHWFDNRLSIELLLEEIREASKRVAELVQSVKKYSHMDQGGGKKMVDIHDGIRTTMAILGHRFKQKQIAIDKQFATDAPKILGNPGELNQVWTNLLSNSIDALPNGGTITVRSKKAYDYFCVEFEDNGSGIPETIINRIWEPFFTTKEVGEGTGIGLDVVKNIIQMHRGNINVTSEPGNRG